MEARDDYAPGPLSTFGEPPVDVSALYVPTPSYQVLGLAQTDRIRPRDGLVIPTIEVTYRVPGLPFVGTIRIDNYAFTHADVLAYMRERAYTIRAMFALPAVSPAYVDAVAAAGA